MIITLLVLLWIAVGIFMAILCDIENQSDTTAFSIFLGSLLGMMMIFILLTFYKIGEKIILHRKEPQ